MKNIIEQIKKIEGVKTIEQAGKDMAVVVFEPENKKQAVRCTTQYEWDFVNQVVHGGKIKTKFGGRWDTIDLTKQSVANNEWYFINGYQIISFSEFLEQRGLRKEFVEFFWTEAADVLNKPTAQPDIKVTFSIDGKKVGQLSNAKIEPSAHLKPEDLIEGEIYFAEKKGMCVESIFRYKCTNINIFDLNLSSSSSFVHEQPIRHATPEEKQKLIKAEVEHGYFHELRTK